MFVRELSPVPCSMVDFLAAWSKLFLTASFVINSSILLPGVLTFWGGCIGLCSDLGVFFSLWSDMGVFFSDFVLCSMFCRLLTDYFVYFECIEL